MSQDHVHIYHSYHGWYDYDWSETWDNESSQRSDDYQNEDWVSTALFLMWFVVASVVYSGFCFNHVRPCARHSFRAPLLTLLLLHVRLCSFGVKGRSKTGVKRRLRPSSPTQSISGRRRLSKA